MAELQRKLEAQLQEATAQTAAMEQATSVELAAKEHELVCAKSELQVLQSTAGADRESAMAGLQVSSFLVLP